MRIVIQHAKRGQRVHMLGELNESVPTTDKILAALAFRYYLCRLQGRRAELDVGHERPGS